jgi:hypothetical protein
VTSTSWAPAGFLDDLGDDVVVHGIGGDVDAERLRQRELVIGDIDGHDMQAHGFRVLHCDVT